jgi:hypothetical protein
LGFEKFLLLLDAAAAMIETTTRSHYRPDWIPRVVAS